MTETETGIRIFVSYRRADTEAMATRVAGKLSKAFGDEVFRDVRTIKPGMRWRRHSRSAKAALWCIRSMKIPIRCAM